MLYRFDTQFLNLLVHKATSTTVIVWLPLHRRLLKQDKPRASTPEFFSDSEEEEPSDTGPDSALDSELSEPESMSESTPVNVVRDKGKSRRGHKGTKNVSQRKEAEDSTVGRLSRTPVQGGKRRRGPDEHQVNPTPTSRGSKRNASRSLSPEPKRRKSQPAPHLLRSQAGSPTIERVDCEEQRGISLILEQLHSMKADHAREVARVETEAQQERARLQAETAKNRDAMHEALAQVHEAMASLAAASHRPAPTSSIPLQPSTPAIPMSAITTQPPGPALPPAHVSRLRTPTARHASPARNDHQAPAQPGQAYLAPPTAPGAAPAEYRTTSATTGPGGTITAGRKRSVQPHAR